MIGPDADWIVVVSPDLKLRKSSLDTEGSSLSFEFEQIKSERAGTEGKKNAKKRVKNEIEGFVCLVFLISET